MINICPYSIAILIRNTITQYIKIRHHIFSADVHKEALMDCYQQCVERYGISLSDMVNQQTALVLDTKLIASGYHKKSYPLA